MGAYGRVIKSLKKILSSVVKEQVLDNEALQTALYEVEAIMNDRPIITVTNGLNDVEPFLWSLWLTFSGEDGSENIFQSCSNKMNGTKLKGTSNLETLLLLWMNQLPEISGFEDGF